MQAGGALASYVSGDIIDPSPSHDLKTVDCYRYWYQRTGSGTYELQVLMESTQATEPTLIEFQAITANNAAWEQFSME